MPFKSEAQRRYMHANLPEIAQKWEKEYPTNSNLPARVSGRRKPSGSIITRRRLRKSLLKN
jgi:hypothetical protein